MVPVCACDDFVDVVVMDTYRTRVKHVNAKKAITATVNTRSRVGSNSNHSFFLTDYIPTHKIRWLWLKPHSDKSIQPSSPLVF